jgi:hypothetical protein
MPNRVHLILCGALIAGSMTAISLPGGTAAAKPLTGTCSSATSSDNSAGSVGADAPSLTINLSGCTDLQDTGGAGVLTITQNLDGNYSSVIAWKGGLTSTNSFAQLSFPRSLGPRGIGCPNPPPGGFVTGPSFHLKGQLTGGTATNLLKSKYKKDAICVYLVPGSLTNPSFIENRPGTVFTF